jgi:hypothetical protein
VVEVNGGQETGHVVTTIHLKIPEDDISLPCLREFKAGKKVMLAQNASIPKYSQASDLRLEARAGILERREEGKVWARVPEGGATITTKLCQEDVGRCDPRVPRHARRETIPDGRETASKMVPVAPNHPAGSHKAFFFFSGLEEL